CIDSPSGFALPQLQKLKSVSASIKIEINF
ncbi:MAG: hypothetical protein ACI917_000904, partial [Patiriisocius sp.]